MENKIQRLGHISRNQKNALIDFVENHPKLLKQRIDNSLSYKQTANLWEECARIVNAIPGAYKPWQNWRKCWRDLKNDVRQKLSGKKKHATQTGGGGASTITLSDLEERISILIDNVTVYGHQDVSESVVNLELPLSENNSMVEYAEEITYVSTPIPIAQVTPIEEISNPILVESTIEHTPNETSSNAPQPRMRKRNVAAQRLIRTLDTANQITQSINKKQDIKEKYYAKKLEMLERLVKAKEKSAEAKVRIAETEDRSLDAKNRIAAGIEDIAKSLANSDNQQNLYHYN